MKTKEFEKKTNQIAISTMTEDEVIELTQNIVELAKNYGEIDINKFNGEQKEIALSLNNLIKIFGNKEWSENVVIDTFTNALLKNLENNTENSIELPKTCYPKEFISPKDKITNKLFDGKLSNTLEAFKIEGLGRKELTAKASIDLDQLEGVQLSNKNITSYDREVHDAIVSLYVDGKNKYITPLMVYRTMTGNPKAKLSPNGKNYNDIIESIERCSKTRVYIDATGETEGKGYNIEHPIFKENLLYTRSVSAKHNGVINEWIEILELPVLYRYANSKNQVARMNISLLNTPINKNEENIVLQGYLQRRIQAMNGSKLSKNILYETVYKNLNIEMASIASLRNKQSKIRDTIKCILLYWKEEGFIKDFNENIGAKNLKVSISIIL